MALQMADAEMQAMADGRRSTLIVEFYLHPVQDEVKTAAEGRPIFEEVEFIRIRVPGDKDEIREKAVTARHRYEFAQQYAAFKNKLEQPLVGTPLEQVPFLTRAQVLEFKALGLKTAENVRDMPDVHAQRFMGIHALRKQVQTFLDAAAGAAPFQKLHAENETLRSQVEAQGRMLKEQADRLDALSKQKK